ncbi:MAG: RNA methyltransferase [Bacteroidales bacterium]|jgi:TrmH family RNA methyltransferase|nr:RNA methyltransferase [Bacteroidaceae bacterium]MDO4201201.1 RNA methyltransferase [Bacteroidales bacterium]
MISKNRLKYVRSLEMKKYRKAEGVFVAEGHKLVGDLLDVFECKYLAATSEWLSANAAWVERQRRSGVEVDEVTDEELKRASFQETPQQVLAVFKQLTYEVDVNEVARKQLCLVLDDVQNPGNLGTIVRLADWFGIEHIFCSKGCADIYNPKTVQATMGGIARVQVHEADLPELLSRLDKDIPVYGTFLDGENMYGKELENRGLIVMGNEGKGVSKEVAAFVTERLYIPNYPEGRETSESLNVAIATAIVCAEFRRR